MYYFIGGRFFKKKIIFFVKNEKAFSGRDLEMYKTMGYTFSSYEKCLSFLNKNFKKKLSMIKNSKKPIRYIYNNDKSFFWNKFLELIDKKYKKKLINLNHKKIKKYLKTEKLEHEKIIICQILKVFFLKIKFYQIFYTKLTPA